MCEVLETTENFSCEIETDLAETNYDEIYKAAEPTFENLPLEIILKICSYLEADFLRCTLRRVCKRFMDILEDESLWKHWVHERVKGFFPPLCYLETYDETQIDWPEVCVEMDVEKSKWYNVEKTMKHLIIKDVHYASVDTVLLMNQGKTCISGGRDRCIALWDVKDIESNASSEHETVLTGLKPTKLKHDGHGGWVWDLATDEDVPNIIYSASWDSTVKAWDIETGLECLETFQCGMSALSVAACDKIVMVGLYSKNILTFDIKSGPTEISSYKPHRGPILALSAFKDKIASVSEDKTLAIYDRVAGKIFKNDIKIPSDKAYPVSMSWSPSAMYIGDSKGVLHLFRPDDFTYVTSHTLWPESSHTEPANKVAGCTQGLGTMIVSSDRGEIKFLYNCNPPQEYKSIQTSTVDITQLRYMNGVLVVGTCDSAIEFWINNESL
ncbi:F-box/WD repeat-containing protein 9-like [Aricia agestis]|uniref:F-box/WD repeat-containing protein 9-like n=1 Tax=Aricia agestis TaxID=91739 RepID=UPI001C20B63C|nr:F-box/WD repeat-containing protein 9-like [Aricia agestis]XP_041974849.1 F-box/WD repeat-containing protein 9-like [Aricia agestis]XP_041974850.1 F-box/WD repeat-containing protein 9-like [Aricia agestis]XP_041974852.1 F-box/WD repeat-containing protein 9-like [Aricia agestis]XP_041974853.1 F-box/WD repeat-containing protein 9-like [Aricia agestis]